MNNSHSCTSMAVKAVVSEIKKRLATRFSFLSGIPDFFYDFDKGLSPQFKQYFAKIPFDKRKNDWTVLAYSYDSSNTSSIQPRRGFEVKRPVTDKAFRVLDARFVELPVVFSLLTNDSKMLNTISTFMQTKLDWSFTIEFEDLLWPMWLPNQNYPLGWYIRPTKPNGRLYMCSKPGLSGQVEPTWSTDITIKQQDNDAEWSCIYPDKLTVKAGSFVKNDTTIQNPIENGIMYQYDFGYTLHYLDLEDAGTFIGKIDTAELKLMSLYGEQDFSEILRVPE